MRNLNQVLLSTKAKIQLLEDFHVRFEFGDDPQTVAEEFIEHGSSLEKEIGNSINEALSNGSPFSEALNGWIPKIALESIRVGESSGNLAKGCENAISTLRSTSESILKFAFEIGKPLLFVLMGIAICSATAVNLMPTLAGQTELNQWPYISRVAYDFGINVTTYWQVYLLITGMIFIGMYFLLTDWVGDTRKAVNSAPLFRQYNLVISIRLLTSIAQLRSIGVSLDESIDILINSEGIDKFTTYHLNEMKMKIQKSQSDGLIGNLLDTGLLEDRLINRLKRVNNPAITEVRLLKQAADEMLGSYRRQMNATTTLISVLNKFLALGMFIWVMAGALLLAIPDTSLF